MSIPSFAAIITAAGASERFNSGNDQAPVKKEFLTVDGQTVLHGAVSPFFAVPSLKAIVVTCPHELEDECCFALGDIMDQNAVPVVICDGGATRQQSVYNALKMLHTLSIDVSYVAIHDGARCFLKPDLIIQTLASATVYSACAPAIPPSDTIKEIDKDGTIKKHLDRKSLINIQTPQFFDFAKILEAHENAIHNGKQYTDDTEIYADMGYRVGVCQGDMDNKKITYLSDIPDAEKQIADYNRAREEKLRIVKAQKALDKAMRSVK